MANYINNKLLYKLIPVNIIQMIIIFQFQRLWIERKKERKKERKGRKVIIT